MHAVRGPNLCLLVIGSTVIETYAVAVVPNTHAPKVRFCEKMRAEGTVGFSSSRSIDLCNKIFYDNFDPVGDPITYQKRQVNPWRECLWAPLPLARRPAAAAPELARSARPGRPRERGGARPTLRSSGGGSALLKRQHCERTVTIRQYSQCRRVAESGGAWRAAERGCCGARGGGTMRSSMVIVTDIVSAVSSDLGQQYCLPRWFVIDPLADQGVDRLRAFAERRHPEISRVQVSTGRMGG